MNFDEHETVYTFPTQYTDICRVRDPDEDRHHQEESEVLTNLTSLQKLVAAPLGI
jgi:hypothetical protein